MSIIDRMRKQTCIWWKFKDFGVDGQPTYLDPIEIDCRWEDTAAEYIDREGVTNVSRSVVYVGEDCKIGDILMLGELESGTELQEIPLQNEGALEIKQFSIVPDLRNRKVLKTAYL